jgi:photosystem II stability/assembly factor-like uncharacterized protein
VTLAVAGAGLWWLTHPSPASGPGAQSVAVGDLHSLVVDPTDARHMFVGGHAAAAETTDGGSSFHSVPGLDNADPMAWSISADGRTHVTSGHMGLRTSTDAAKTWADLTGKLPYSDVHAVGLDPDHPSNWIAFVVGRGIYTTTDSGRTWTSKGNQNASLYGPILVSPGGQVITASGPVGIVRSNDGARSWTRISPLQAGFLSVDPTDPNHLYAAGGQVSQSRDGGSTWQPIAGPASGARAIAVVQGADPTLVAVVPSGDSFRLLRSRDAGISWA